MKYVLWIESDDGERCNTHTMELDSADIDSAINESLRFIIQSGYWLYELEGSHKHVTVLEVSGEHGLQDRLVAAFDEKKKAEAKAKAEWEGQAAAAFEAHERAEYDRLCKKFGPYYPFTSLDGKLK